MAIPLAPGAKGGATARPSAPSKSAPIRIAPASTKTGSNPRGVAIARTPAPTINDRAATTLGTGANPRGVAISGPKPGGITAPKERQSIIETFMHQPAAQKVAILKGAAKLPPSDPYRQILQGIHLPAQIGGGLSTAAITNATAGINPTGVLKVIRNAAEDTVNLPAESFSSLATVGVPAVKGIGAALSGNAPQAGKDLGTAGKNLTGGYVQLAQHPLKTFLAHPVDSLLMAGSLVDPASAAAGAAVRGVAGDSALAGAIGPKYEVPPSVHLTGDLTHERPALSSYPATRAGQKVFAKALYAKSPTGELVPKTDWLRERLLRQETSHSLVGARERIRKAGVQNQIVAHMRSVLSPRAGRVAHSVSTALKYDPGSALIHGANVLSLVADHTIRTKASFFADLAKRIDAVSARRPDLVDFPQALKEHDQNVAELKAALNDKALQNPKNMDRLFEAAHKYAADIKPLTNEAFAHGHFGDITKEGLQRRELQPVVLAHMPGARLDPVQGMVKDLPNGTSRPLSTQEMLAFDKQQTGGRPLAYTSHAQPKGDSAFYTNQQKYPARAIKQNTGYAYLHGLNDPTHESLLQNRVELENAINAHRSMDHILNSTVLGHPNGGFWQTHAEATRDAPPGYSAIQVGRMTAKDRTEAPTPDNLGHEAEVRSLDLNARLQPTSEPGKFGLMDNTVVDQLRSHQNQISPNTFMRMARSATGQFRRVALGTSLRHIPGVTQEGLIRDVGAGLGPRSWLTSKNVFKALNNLDPRTAAEKAAGVTPEDASARVARELNTELSGGTVGGMTRSMETRQGSKYFGGTVMGPPMKAAEAFFKAPGPRQLAHAWGSWQKAVINGSKNVLEHNQQSAAVGQALLKESGKLMALQGKAADEAARGLLDPARIRQLRAQVERVHGKWTDLTPSGQTGLMFSPFGMWWVNSVKWLARMPIDQPVKSGLLASATLSSAKQRQAEGLDMFSPGHLAGYLQGSVPVGNKLYGEQYYSPAGVAGDPWGTAVSLAEPTALSTILAAAGDNYLGHTLTSPSNPKGYKSPTGGNIATAVLMSVLSNFVPLETKLQTALQGGASAYDTSTPWNVQTKVPNPGIGAGLLKDINPLRSYPNPGLSTSGGSAKIAIPGHGSINGVVIPGHGSTSGVVIP